MKKLTLIIALCTILMAGAQARLIDLTPGGFDATQPYPEEFLRYLSRIVGNRATFFDAASPNGWANTGALNGGTYFSTDLIGNAGTTANISWNFSTLSGWTMTFLLVEGDHWINLYAVPVNFQITDLGDLVTLHDDINIDFISFVGRNPNSASVPEGGSTVVLMGLGLIGMLFVQRRFHA